MFLALVILLALTLAVSTGALVVGLLVLAAVRRPTSTTNVVNAPATPERPGFGAPPFGRHGGHPSSDEPVTELPKVRPGPGPGGARPSTVQSRAVDPEAPTQTYGAVRPEDHA